MLVLHMPETVGKTLENAQAANPDHLVTIFREPSGVWRVGWSKMDLAALCLAREYLDHCVREVVAESYRESLPA